MIWIRIDLNLMKTSLEQQPYLFWTPVNESMSKPLQTTKEMSANSNMSITFSTVMNTEVGVPSALSHEESFDQFKKVVLEKL